MAHAEVEAIQLKGTLFHSHTCRESIDTLLIVGCIQFLQKDSTLSSSRYGTQIEYYWASYCARKPLEPEIMASKLFVVFWLLCLDTSDTLWLITCNCDLANSLVSSTRLQTAYVDIVLFFFFFFFFPTSHHIQI